MNQFKKMATMALAASLCLAMLAGCGNKKADEDDSGLDEVVVEQQMNTLLTCRKSRRLTFSPISVTCRK